MKSSFFTLTLSDSLRSARVGMLLILLSGVPAILVQAEDAPQYNPGEFILAEGNENLQNKALTLLDEASSEPLAVTDTSAVGIKVETPEGYDPESSTGNDEDICAKLRKIEREKQSEGHINRRFYRQCNRNGLFFADLTTVNDPYYSAMWALQRLNMTSAWSRTTGSSSVVVAIVDTGVNYNHPDLTENMWQNTGEIPGNGIDDDGNGYIDDVYGYNAISNNGNPMDDNGHGTHVAGTIGAKSNNGIGVSGINWDVKIMATKFLSSSGSGSLLDALKALRYIRTMKDRGTNVILSNNSWGGGGYYSLLYDEIKAAKDDGILFVAAAGNSSIDSDANPQYPAAYDLDNVISVAAVDENGGLASYSNYGSTTVDLAAPGSNIASCWVDGGYRYLSGTSMATPHVSGALALMKAYSSGLSATQLKQYLLASVSPNTALQGKVLTNGELNIDAVLQSLPYTPPSSSLPNVPTPVPTLISTIAPTPTSTPVPPTPTQTPAPIAGNLHIQVLSDGLSLGQVAVSITGPNGFSTTGLTGTDGIFNAPNLPGGTYSATLSKQGYAIAGPTIIYVNGETYTNVFATRSQYIVKAIIMNKENAALLANLSVDLYIEGQLAGNSNTATDGTVAFSVPYGARYRLEVKSPNYYLESVDDTVTGRVTRTIALTAN